MKITEILTEQWSQKYKNSINCSHPKGFSQRAHCAGKKKHNESAMMEMTCPDCGMCQTHGTLNEIRKGQKDANGYTKCWPGHHAQGTKPGKNGGRVRNCVPNESEELSEEFDLIESIIEDLAERNGVDSEVIWEDLESLDDDELYVFATTSTIMENTVQIPHKGKMVSGKVVRKDPVSGEYIVDVGEYGSVRVPAHKVKHDVEEDWQKANKKDRTNGMSRKAVKAYRREHPGSKLQTAVTTKPSKLKKGSKASKRRKSYCSRSRGQMKMHNISCAKTPDKAICKARRRWNC